MSGVIMFDDIPGFITARIVKTNYSVDNHPSVCVQIHSIGAIHSEEKFSALNETH